MKKSDLLNLAVKVTQRNAYRKLLFFLLYGLIWGALILGRSSPYRHLYVWVVAIVGWAILIFLMAFINRRTKADCHEFGALCPKCGAPLFSALWGIRNVVQRGFCRHCHCRLYDDTVV